MIRIKVSSIGFADNTNNSTQEIKIEGIAGKSKNSSVEVDEVFKAIKDGEDFVLITNKSFLEKTSGRSGKKSNPLMLNFESYSE